MQYQGITLRPVKIEPKRNSRESLDSSSLRCEEGRLEERDWLLNMTRLFSSAFATDKGFFPKTSLKNTTYKYFL